jgi:hypothetical protein
MMHAFRRLVRVDARPLEKASSEVDYQGEEHEKVATSFLLLRAVLEPIESVLSE